MFLIVLVGPTGVGKTEVALELAQRLKTEIISADSRQVYKYMDVGTAKPTRSQQELVRHYLIDLIEPDQIYSAADYARDAGQVIQQFHTRGQIPLLVGGTGLYIRAVTEGIFEGPGADPDFRQEMERLAGLYGSDYLHCKLQRIDPETALRLHAHDLVRIIRALEVYHLTGKPLSYHHKQSSWGHLRYPTCFLGLTRPREELYHRINRRVEAMIAQGFVEEVKTLLEKGYQPSLHAMQSLGYKQMTEFILKGGSLDKTVLDIQKETRHYAKRQLTWFRQNPRITWLHLLESQAPSEVIQQCLRLIKAFYSKVKPKDFKNSISN
ncbi:MAG TPA: tRNA (adenosine(37)-N6)-dimethylallyltransferase MiaA [Candidatus Limnocylindrales bacterium]|nr:tRNA (adenosine(37)-N6)-dimethylallyltransferase MiaA [Candidatus Limnocylindrales bacterium]